MAKKFFQYLMVVAFLFLGSMLLVNKIPPREYVSRILELEKPCDKPLEYSIGNIDPRFNISRDDLLKTAAQAEKVWENPSGKNLFQYNPETSFKINLVFDSRQEQTLASRKLEEQLSQLESSHDSIMQEYDSLSATYKKRIDAYNKAVAKYKDDLEKYNEEVSYWNKQGGAPPDTYEDLKDQKKELDKRFDNLEKERIAINNLAGKANNLAQQSNKIADTYNQNLNTYKNRFGESVQFDKGVYNGQEIDIYQFYETGDLRLTLAHELGHALGIDHLENSKSVMYYLMGDQDMDHPVVSPEDLQALKDVCKLN